MKSEFSLAFNQICAEYSLPREVVLDAVRAALVTAYRRDWKVAPTQNVTADISLETGLARIYIEKIAVETVEDPDTQISMKEACKQKPNVQAEDVVLVDVTPRNFGRIAAQTAKQVITQRLREAERESQFNRFSRQENEIIIGAIQSLTPHGVTLHLERTEEALMPRREQIPGERYMLHQKIRVYVLEVKRTPRGPEIIVSRSHPLMLRRLLELEVPEVRSGQVEIKSIAREAGARSKVAVLGRQPGLDPVGACVGMRGIRIQTISRELHGERIDVVEWSNDPAAFIANALSMNQVMSVMLDESNPGGRTASVVVMDDQLSLAIGRSGQNARLAAKLTGWRVDIQGATEAAVWALEQVNANPELLDNLKGSASLVPHLAAVMRVHESEHYPYTDEERKVIKTGVEAIRQALIDRRNAERPTSRLDRARRTAQEQAEAERREAKKEALARVPQAAYQMSLEELNLSEKVMGNLLRSGLLNVGEIMERIALGDEALLMLSGIGVKALREIKDAVEQTGITFIEAIAEAEETVETIAEEVPVEVVEVVVEELAVLAATESELESVAEVEPEPVVAQPEFEAGVETETVEEVAEAAPAIVVVAEVQEEVEEAEMEPAVPEAVFRADVFSAVIEAYADDAEVEDEGAEARRKGGKKVRKGRAVLYDDEKGETYVVRKRRRRTDMWEEIDSDF